jgi:pimeloyl-ACP methyl ester carboxylesterase
MRSQLRAEGRRFAAAVSTPVTAPVLTIHGADDPCVLPATAAASAQWAGAGLQQHVLHRAGHFPHQERPGQVRTLLRDFVSSIS